MNARQQASRERLQRYLSLVLAVVTSLLLVPPGWIRLDPNRKPPREPEPRPIEIVRLPPETLPPPPPLPDRPRPRPRPRREPEPPPPEPRLELRADVPEIELPRERRDERRLAIRTRELATPRFEQEVPDPDVPRPMVRDRRRAAVRADDAPTPRLAREEPQVEVPVPRAVPREQQRERIEVARMTARSYHEADAPDVEVVTPRPAARPSAVPLPTTRQARTGAALRPAQQAPDVDVPRGNSARPDRRAPLAVSGAWAGTPVTVNADPGDAPDVAVPSPRKGSAKERAPALAVAAGGSAGLKYSAAPADAPVGTTGRPRTGATSPRLESVRAALSRRYGLPLVSVQQLGERSTDAARWNVLLPQISDLLREARRRPRLDASPGDEVVEVRRDGDRLIIRYRDGVVHVLVPGDDGLAMLFVARDQGARPVTSKVEEGESARRVLALLTRGAS